MIATKKLLLSLLALFHLAAHAQLHRSKEPTTAENGRHRANNIAYGAITDTLPSLPLTSFRLAQQAHISSSPETRSTDACSNWLYTPSQPSFVRVGDLDITGNKLTVEASFIRTEAWSGADVFQGDLVSKHEGPADVNYLLRPGSAEITTERGYFKTPVICNIELNKTYHAAMTYDGAMLRFYRNGFLMSETPASGNLVTNDWQTQIGLYFNQVTREQFVGYINEVRIWNVVRSQAELRTNMNQALPAPTTQAGLLAYYSFDDLRNKQGNTRWNGTLHGAAAITQTNPSCTFVADSCGTRSCADQPQPDFSFQYATCSPGNVRFFTEARTGHRFSWQFPGGATASGNSIAQTITSAGNYRVRLAVNTSAGCNYTVEKTIVYNPAQTDLIRNGDTTICSGDSVALRLINGLVQECWEPNGVRADPQNGVYTIRPTANMRLALHALAPQANLLSNADFSNGTGSINSAYTENPNATQTGFRVANGTAGWGSPVCTGAAGNGNMLLVRTAGDKGKTIWKQRVAVTPGTDYLLAVKVLSMAAPNAPFLQWAVNGVAVGAPFGDGANGCLWQQQAIQWNAGNQTSVELALLSATESSLLTNFAIDDLFFGRFQLQYDSWNLNVKAQPTLKLSGDTAVCTGTPALLRAQTSEPQASISWWPANSLSNAAVFDPTARPTTNTLYTATLRDAAGCTRTDSLLVRLLPLPQFTAPRSFSICVGQAVRLVDTYTNTGNALWSPGSSIDDSTRMNVAFSPATTTQYKVRLTSPAGCVASDSIRISVWPNPMGVVSNEAVITCTKTWSRLQATGGTRYEWSPATGLNDPRSATPIASPAETTTYNVRIFNENNCSTDLSIEVPVNRENGGAIYTPNAFTPNNDGVNDCFTIPQLRNASRYSLEVFSRWGQLVFASTNPAQCWNGQLNGIGLPQGVYVYRLNATGFCAAVDQHGTIMLIR